MADEATNVLRQALAATQSADTAQRKQGDPHAATNTAGCCCCCFFVLVRGCPLELCRLLDPRPHSHQTVKAAQPEQCQQTSCFVAVLISAAAAATSDMSPPSPVLLCNALRPTAKHTKPRRRKHYVRGYCTAAPVLLTMWYMYVREVSRLGQTASTQRPCVAAHVVGWHACYGCPMMDRQGRAGALFFCCCFWSVFN